MEIFIPVEVEFIFNRLNNFGHEAYAVGGCVRDSLLSLCPNDWDICTSALPDDIILCFKELRVIKTGMKHGTVTLLLEGKKYEITTYRTEGAYSDYRHPDEVEFVSSLKEDLHRRDFTINAMAYNKKEKLIDYFGGLNDINKRLIRCVGNCSTRLKEDPLRILRALRLAAKYNFVIDKETKEAIYKNKALLKYLSAERIKEEFNKLLLSQGVEHLLLEYPLIISEFIPQLICSVGYFFNDSYHVYDIWTHTVKSITNSKPDLNIRLALLFHDMAKPFFSQSGSNEKKCYCSHAQASAQIAKETLTKLKYDKKTIETVVDLVFYHDIKLSADIISVKRWLNKFGLYKFKQLLEIKIADAKAQNPAFLKERLKIFNDIIINVNRILENNFCFTIKDLDINGKDIISLGYDQGEKVGEILKYLLEQVISEEVKNEKSQLIKSAKNYDNN